MTPSPQPLTDETTFCYDNDWSALRVTYSGGDMVQILIQDKSLSGDLLRNRGCIALQIPLEVWYSAYAHVADRLPGPEVEKNLPPALDPTA